MGASNNSEFAQMPHKGTPIRYGLKPMRNRMQGAEKICELGNKPPIPAYPVSPRRI